MTIARLVLAMTLSLLFLLTGAAQETQSPPNAGENQAEPPAPAPAPESEQPRTLEQIFIPSEEIAADEEVTFPINI